MIHSPTLIQTLQQRRIARRFSGMETNDGHTPNSRPIIEAKQCGKSTTNRTHRHRHALLHANKPLKVACHFAVFLGDILQREKLLVATGIRNFQGKAPLISSDLGAMNHKYYYITFILFDNRCLHGCSSVSIAAWNWL